MPDAAHPAPIVRAALGWRARDVERQSTAPVHFRDRDYSQALLTDDPVQLVYADPAHGFTLPPGRYLRVVQDAGRVSALTAAPQLDALPRARARVLLLQLAATLEAAGWGRSRDSRSGAFTELPTEQAVDRALDAAAGRTFGLTGVATWRVARPAAPWAALPRGAVHYNDVWDGLEAVLTLNTLDSETDSTPGAARYAVNLDINDEDLGRALSIMAEARQARLGDAGATLTGWDREPYEPFRAPAQPKAASASDSVVPH